MFKSVHNYLVIVIEKKSPNQSDFNYVNYQCKPFKNTKGRGSSLFSKVEKGSFTPIIVKEISQKKKKIDGILIYNILYFV